MHKINLRSSNCLSLLLPCTSLWLHNENELGSSPPCKSYFMSLLDACPMYEESESIIIITSPYQLNPKVLHSSSFSMPLCWSIIYYCSSLFCAYPQDCAHLGILRQWLVGKRVGTDEVWTGSCNRVVGNQLLNLTQHMNVSLKKISSAFMLWLEN